MLPMERAMLPRERTRALSEMHFPQSTRSQPLVQSKEVVKLERFRASCLAVDVDNNNYQ